MSDNLLLLAERPLSMLFEAACDARDAFKLLRVGLSDNRHVCELIDAHLDELEYAIEKARASVSGEGVGE